MNIEYLTNASFHTFLIILCVILWKKFEKTSAECQQKIEKLNERVTNLYREMLENRQSIVDIEKESHPGLAAQRRNRGNLPPGTKR